MRSNGRRACASGSRHVWWTYSAAPWSISQVRPCQMSRFGLATVRSGLVTRPSSQTTSAAKTGSTTGSGRRVERQRTGQEVQAEVEPAARLHEVVDLLVGLGVAQVRVDIDERQVRHGQPDGARELAGQPLGDERPRTLAGAAELDHVQPVVVRLDEAGQRTALAQGRDVAGGGDHRRHPGETTGPRRGRGDGRESGCRGGPVQVRTRSGASSASAVRLVRHACTGFRPGRPSCAPTEEIA